MSALAAPPPVRSAFDVERVRADFPALSLPEGGKALVYLDNTATTQKPAAVLEAERRFYLEDCANVHRGVYGRAARASAAYERARATTARFLNAADPAEIAFVRGTTEAVNLVAQTFARKRLRARAHGDAILVTELEHHSNLVPWQLLCEDLGARFLVAPLDARGEVIQEEYVRLLGEGVALAAFAHVSNALGTVNPVAEMTRLAHERGVPVLVDGAQAVPHLPVDVQALGCDFYCFSGHKVFGPTGIGALYGRRELLDAMPPYQGGGSMIQTVELAGSTYAAAPHRFEAGTPHIAGAIGLGAALAYVEGVGREAAAQYERELHTYAEERLAAVPGLRMIGTARAKAALSSFVLEGAHPHDIATILDAEGIAVRAGHHCAQPVMDHFRVPATVRASFAFYNTAAEVDALVVGLEKVRRIFGP